MCTVMFHISVECVTLPVVLYQTYFFVRILTHIGSPPTPGTILAQSLRLDNVVGLDLGMALFKQDFLFVSTEKLRENCYQSNLPLFGETMNHIYRRKFSLLSQVVAPRRREQDGIGGSCREATWM